LDEDTPELAELIQQGLRSPSKPWKKGDSLRHLAGSAQGQTMRLETTEEFDSDRGNQFLWYLTETDLEPEPALELAERFARTVDDTLELISSTPAIGRRRFPKWAKFRRPAAVSSFSDHLQTRTADHTRRPPP
jgi:hypothetical protein